jgi:hypothetical protein
MTDEATISIEVTQSIPFADAGPAQWVTSGDQVQLDGTRSSGFETNASYSWKQIVGPEITLSSPLGVNSSFVAPIVESNTLLTFELAVNDTSGKNATGIVDVTVVPKIDTLPVLTVPEDIVVEATTTTNGDDGTQVTYTVTAQDDVDGTATLEDDGATITQDNIGADITISCDPHSGSTFTLGDTEVQCTATDAAGNEGTTALFSVTVNPPSSPPTPSAPAQAIDELISSVENLDGVSQNIKRRLAAASGQASNILTDDNPNNDMAVCGMLTAFIKHVNVYERLDTLPAEPADDLRTQAQNIRNMLDC